MNYESFQILFEINLRELNRKNQIEKQKEAKRYIVWTYQVIRERALRQKNLFDFVLRFVLFFLSLLQKEDYRCQRRYLIKAVVAHRLRALSNLLKRIY